MDSQIVCISGFVLFICWAFLKKSWFSFLIIFLMALLALILFSFESLMAEFFFRLVVITTPIAATIIYFGPRLVPEKTKEKTDEF